MLAIAVGANSPYHNPGEKIMSKICAVQTAGSSLENAKERELHWKNPKSRIF
jgi:hypothetical protein